MKINLRKARLQDSRFLYECRNDEEARGNARETGEITYQEHKAWLRRNLKLDSQTILYIGKINQERLGIVRFFTDETPTEVGIHLHPSRRRQGYGTALLQETLKD